MADYNRNQRGAHRISNYDWNEDRGRGRYDEDRNSESDSRYENDFEEGNAGWQSRYQREDRNSGRGNIYGSGRYGRHYESEFNTGNFGRDRGYGYDRDQGYGSSYYGSGSGSSYDNDRGNSYRNRNLYDRDYQGMGRSNYSGTRLGGSNYGEYGDNRRYYEGRNEGRGQGGYRGYYGSPGERGEDRSWWDKTSDEISSWFGDEDAERRRERDRIRAEYRGKGPKNYKRSDERIKDDINDRLSDDPFIDATDIEVSVSDGEVTLTGTVDERNGKRRAEDIAENVSGVKNVENRIKVGQRSNVMSGGVQTETTSVSGSQTTSAVPGSERSKSKNYVTG